MYVASHIPCIVSLMCHALEFHDFVNIPFHFNRFSHNHFYVDYVSLLLGLHCDFELWDIIHAPCTVTPISSPLILVSVDISSHTCFYLGFSFMLDPHRSSAIGYKVRGGPRASSTSTPLPWKVRDK